MFIIRWLKRLVFWTIISLIAVAVFLSRCSIEDLYQQVRSKVSDQVTSVSIPENANPLVNAIKTSLSKELSISAEQITVSKTEFILWPDSCMSIPTGKRICKSIVTPGYKIVLNANGMEYEFHGDQKGNFERKV